MARGFFHFWMPPKTKMHVCVDNPMATKAEATTAPAGDTTAAAAAATAAAAEAAAAAAGAAA